VLGRPQLLLLSLIFLMAISAFAQQAAAPAPAVADESTTAVSDEAQTAALAKAAQNPIANLIRFSTPKQHEFRHWTRKTEIDWTPC
jgi:hypothetical protein